MSVRKRMHSFSLALAITLGVGACVARAGPTAPNLSNLDQVCPTNGINQYTIVYLSTGALNIQQLWVGPAESGTIPPSQKESFPPGTSTQGQFLDVSSNGTITQQSNGDPVTNITVSNNDTSKVTVTFTGTTFNAGDWTHIGVNGTGSSVHVEDSWWSTSGTESSSIDGHQPGVTFQGTSTNWEIVRVTLYDPQDNVIGHEWVEQQATGFVLTGSSVPLDVSTATMISPTEIPLDQLNGNLTGFGPESGIMTLSAMPEPSALILASVGFLGVLIYARASRRHK
jgi:hypothetical protein